jgi:hypothetical protein
MSGLNTTVSYYLRDHFAVEGSVTAAFGSPSSDAKYIFYGGGVRVSKGNPRLQPFAHALVGGIHIFPQAASGNNGFAFRVGGSAETRLRQQIWLRVEGDRAFATIFVGTKQFPSRCFDELPFLAPGRFGGVLRC